MEIVRNGLNAGRNTGDHLASLQPLRELESAPSASDDTCSNLLVKVQEHRASGFMMAPNSHVFLTVKRRAMCRNGDNQEFVSTIKDLERTGYVNLPGASGIYAS